MAKRTKAVTKRAATKRAVTKKTATKKAATKKAATTKAATTKAVTKQSANAKAPASKAPAAKPAKKAPATKPTKKAAAKTVTKSTAKSPATSAAAPLRIASITPSADGAKWTVVTSDGAKRRIAAGAAQSSGVKAGGRWTDALARKVERAEREQKLFTKAMGILAKSGATSYEVLVKKLGGDADARATVSALVENGWIS